MWRKQQKADLALNKVYLGTDAVLIDGMRLLLASVALSAYLIEIPGSVDSNTLALTVLAGYLIYSFALFAASHIFPTNLDRRYTIWGDVAWYGILTAVTDPFRNGLFLFFLFAILTASFRYGCKEGRRVTTVSALLYASVALSTEFPTADFEWTWFFLRMVFLFGLGFMIAYWGGSEVSLRQRLELLREVNQLSNPRFGVDQTVASIMEKLRQFFDGDACFVVTHDHEGDSYFMREVHRANAVQVLRPKELPKAAAQLLLPFHSQEIALKSAHANRWIGQARGQSMLYRQDAKKLIADSHGLCESVASMLNTTGFISVPLQSLKIAGRLYITSQLKSYTMNDALFLSQAVEQAFKLIEHVQTLDRLASNAADEMRHRLAGNLHDTALQPYIGLRMGLQAMRAQAEPGNSLTDSIDHLINMTSAVVDDLRSYAVGLRNSQFEHGHLLIGGIRRKAAQFADFYGIHIDVQAEGHINVSDRLAAEVLQMVAEGLSNIRKHTKCEQGSIKLIGDQHVLNVVIENDCDERPGKAFVPRSIATRVKALGGQLKVEHGHCDSTIVSLTIPI